MAERSPFGSRTPPQLNAGARSTPMASKTRTLARSPLQSQMATPNPEVAVANSAMANRMENIENMIQNLSVNLSQHINQLSINIHNMDQKLTSRMDSMQAGIEQNSKILGDVISRVHVIEVVVEKRIPELVAQQDMLRAETQQCINELHERGKKDMQALEDFIFRKIEAELNVSAAHVDQQVTRISGDLRREIKMKDDELEGKLKQGFLDIEQQLENKSKVEDDDQVTSATEANKKHKSHYDSDTENEADDIVKINKRKVNRRRDYIKESDDPLFFRKSQIIEERPRRSKGGDDSSPDDSDSDSSSEGSHHGKSRSRGDHGSRKGRSLIVKTREDFRYLALKHLDKWHMEELIDFLDEYELVSDRNPQADLRMVHFMEKDVLAIFKPYKAILL